jgi:hypothetical protein
MPGRPVTTTGRPGAAKIRCADNAATTGPVQASSTTSGRFRRTWSRTAASEATVTGRRLAARIWLAEGITGFSTTSWVASQAGGRPSRVAALHLR